MLADMATEIDAARLLTWRAAALKDAGADHILAAAEAKLFASDVAVKAARDCVQIFGGYGYLRDFPAERHYRDNFDRLGQKGTCNDCHLGEATL